MTVVRGEAARRLMARTRLQVIRPERRRDPAIDREILAAGQARPALSGPVLWTVVEQLAVVTRSGGLPRARQRELHRLLQGWFQEPSGVLQQATSCARAIAVKTQGPGLLRISGTGHELLIERVCRPAPEEGPQSAVKAPGSGARSGDYRTVGESGSRHVRWITMPLPSAAGPPLQPWTGDAWA